MPPTRRAISSPPVWSGKTLSHTRPEQMRMQCISLPIPILHPSSESTTRRSSTLQRPSAQTPYKWEYLLTSLLLCDPVDTVIRVSLCPYSSADGNGGSLSLDSLAIGIDVCNLDLDGSVVFRSDKSVYWRASAASEQRGSRVRERHRSRRSGRSKEREGSSASRSKATRL